MPPGDHQASVCIGQVGGWHRARESLRILESLKDSINKSLESHTRSMECANSPPGFNALASTMVCNRNTVLCIDVLILRGQPQLEGDSGCDQSRCSDDKEQYLTAIRVSLYAYVFRMSEVGSGQAR